RALSCLKKSSPAQTPRRPPAGAGACRAGRAAWFPASHMEKRLPAHPESSGGFRGFSFFAALQPSERTHDVVHLCPKTPVGVAEDFDHLILALLAGAHEIEFHL